MTDSIIFAVPALYLLLQWIALGKMRDNWHVAAVLPAAFMGAALVIVALGLMANSDMALLVLLVGLPVATLYLIALLPIYFLFHGQRH
jgi:uncharacterized protein YqcC (DUF446 family)